MSLLAGFVVVTVVLSILGLVGRLFVFDGALGDAEADFLAWIADRRVDALEPVSTIVSAVSDTRTVVGILLGSTSMLWIAGWRRQALAVLFSVVIEFTAFLAVGALIGRTRPDVDALTAVPSTPSYPSGHTAAAFVLYGALVLVARSISQDSVPRWVWSIPIVLAVLVASSRVYDGVHYPFDVVAGLLLGVGALLAAGHASGVSELSRLRRSTAHSDRPSPASARDRTL